MTMSGRFFMQSTAGLLLVGLLALLGIIGMTFWLGERAGAIFDEAIAARDARTAASELRNALQSAESSQRGFLVTGNQIYLAPFDVARSLAERHLDEVQQLFAAYPETRGAVDRLALGVAEKFSEMDRIIALKRERRDEEALAVFRTNRGKALMDEANVLLSGLVRTADSSLTTGVAEHRRNAAWLRRFSIIGGVVIVVVVGAAALAGLRYTRELREARETVLSLNAGLEERVRERTADLARANEEVQRFAYVVTHDLRAPLVNIMGFTTELEVGVRNLQALIDKSKAGEDLSDPVARQARIAASQDLPEAIGFIRSSTKKMDTLINAILRIARDGRRALRPEPVRLADVVQSSLETVRHQSVEAGGQFEFEVDVPRFVSDRQALEQVFANLLDNAIKYRAAERPLKVGIRAAMAGNSLSIEVADNGRGIAEHDQSRVFELFRRSGVQDQSGEGIGLAYVRTMVGHLGGRIGVTSKLGQGTTFCISLPTSLPPTESATS